MVEVFFYHPANVLGDSVLEIVVFVWFEGQLAENSAVESWFRRVLDASKYSCTWLGKL